MSDSPAIAIFAASPVRYRYWAQMAKMAGFLVIEEDDTKILPVLCLREEGSISQPQGDIKTIKIGKEKLPIRAADMIREMIMSSCKDTSPAHITISGCVLDRINNLWFRQGQDDGIRLTEKETQILSFLKNNKNAVSRDALLKEIWRYAPDVETHTIETHIYRLRQKIEENPSAPKILLTQDEGYILCT